VETIFDVFRHLCTLLGSGPVHDEALAIIDAFEADLKTASPGNRAAGLEGDQR